jgi:TolB protein
MPTKSQSTGRETSKPSVKKQAANKLPIAVVVALIGLFGTIIAAIGNWPGNPTLTQSNSTNIPQPQITPFANRAGDKIFFLRGKDYYVMSLDGTYQTLIAKYPQALVLCPTVSSDGEKMLFNSNFEGHTDLYVIDRDGYNLKNITNTMGYDEVCGSWSPDQKHIIFYIQYSDDNNDLVEIDVDGKNEIQLTDTLNNSIGAKNMISEAAWSPDGNKIVFSSDVDGDLEIYIYEFDTKNIVQVTENTIDDYRASWSPDGTKIVYTSRIQGDNTEVFVLDLTHTTFPAVGVNLTNDLGHDTDATWSPDGKRIAFVSSRGGNDDIYIMDADGNNLWKLSNTPEDETKPQWIN